MNRHPFSRKENDDDDPLAFQAAVDRAKLEFADKRRIDTVHRMRDANRPVQAQPPSGGTSGPSCASANGRQRGRRW